jgi:hypothetical protein
MYVTGRVATAVIAFSWKKVGFECLKGCIQEHPHEGVRGTGVRSGFNRPGRVSHLVRALTEIEVAYCRRSVSTCWANQVSRGIGGQEYLKATYFSPIWLDFRGAGDGYRPPLWDRNSTMVVNR